MALDINSEKGQESLKQEELMISHIEKCWGVEICITDRKFEVPLDGILVKKNRIIGVCENKCRNLTLTDDGKLYDRKLNKFYDSWLITNDKMDVGRMGSIFFRVPFLGFLYLVDDNITLFWKITDEYGNFLFDFDKETTPTQANINGGTALRLNAFLPLKHSKRVEFKNTRP